MALAEGEKLSNSKQSAVYKKLLGYSWGPILGALISFVTVPLLTRLVEPAQFGKSAFFSLALTIFTLIAFLGLDQAFVREYHNSSDVGILLSSTSRIPFFITFCCAVCTIVFWRPFSYLLFAQYDFFSVFVFSVQLPFLVLSRFSELCIRMKEKASLFSFMAIFSRIMNLALLVVLLVFFEKSYRAIIIAQAAATILNAIVFTYFSREYWSGLTFRKKLQYRSLLRYGLPLMPASILMWAMDSLSMISLKANSGYSDIGIYTSAAKVAGIIAIFQGIFSSFWAPTAFRWQKEGQGLALFDATGRLVLSGMSALLCGIFLGKGAIVFILGPAYRDASKLFFALCLVPVLGTISEVCGLGIPISRKTNWSIVISFASVVVEICGLWLAVPLLGASGAAISVSAAYFVYFWLRFLISRKLWIRMSIWPYLANSVLFIAIGSTQIGTGAELLGAILAIVCIIYNLMAGWSAFRKTSRSLR